MTGSATIVQLTPDDDVGSVMLSSTVSVAQYQEYEATKNKKAIADFIKQRFRERYVVTMLQESTHGFCIMANCCLMIEALESFRQGWEDTKERGRSPGAFERFFDRAEQFELFRQRHSEFYHRVRCGILHQAETTGGWRGSRYRSGYVQTNAEMYFERHEEF